jgi:hypothetical protein
MKSGGRPTADRARRDDGITFSPQVSRLQLTGTTCDQVPRRRRVCSMTSREDIRAVDPPHPSTARDQRRR